MRERCILNLKDFAAEETFFKKVQENGSLFLPSHCDLLISFYLSTRFDSLAKRGISCYWGRCCQGTCGLKFSILRSAPQLWWMRILAENFLGKQFTAITDCDSQSPIVLLVSICKTDELQSSRLLLELESSYWIDFGLELNFVGIPIPVFDRTGYLQESKRYVYCSSWFIG